MENRLRSLLAVGLAVPVFLGLTLGSATRLFSESASPGAVPASPGASPGSPSPAAWTRTVTPSAVASPLAAWASLPRVPESPPPSEAEKRGQELSIIYTSNILGEIDPCG